ncbi:MAG: MFS transporter [Ruminococcaceae bacterium]|nr:MFS transporter [Oscillospiraceae bacterium]
MITILIVIYVVFISLGLPDSLLGVAWPVLHNEMNVPESFASVMSIIIGVCTGGVSFVSGTLIRKFGTARVTLASIFVTALGLVGISFSPNIVLMIIFSIILGYGAGAIDTGVNNFVSLHYNASHMNFLHCFWGVGVTVSPMIMSVFLGGEEGSWRNGYRVVALLQVLIALAVVTVMRKWINAEKSTVISDEEGGEKEEKGFFEIMKIRGVPVSILSLGLYCSMEFICGTWGATYIVNVFSLEPSVAAKWVSLYYGGIMLGRLVSGFVATRLGDNRLIRLGIVFSAFGIIVLLLPVGKASLVGFLLMGFGFGPVFPSVLHNIPERFGVRYSADITGFHMGGAYAIGFGAQLIYGFTATSTSFKITGFVLLALCAGLFAANMTALKQIKEKKM